MKKLSFASGVAAIVLAATSIFPVAGVFAKLAADTITGNPVTLRRTVSGVTNPVTNTFTYTITAGSKPKTTSTATGVPASTTIAFNNEAVSGGSAVKTNTIDFSAVQFSDAGDYTWTVAETGSTDTTNYPIDTSHNNYTIQASVRYPVDSNNVPDNSQYIVTMTIADKNGGKVSEATWISTASRTYIEAVAKTTGNKADTSECFAYDIDIPAAVGGTYTIAISPTSGACSSSASSVTAGTTATVYLKHGDTVRVGDKNGTYELPIGVQYTIAKQDDSDDYTEKMDGSNGSSVTKTTVASNAANFNTENHTDIENNWQANPLTGIVTNFWFYLVLLIIGAFGIIVFMRKKQDDEDQQQQA